jgi:hypothetical protein
MADSYLPQHASMLLKLNSLRQSGIQGVVEEMLRRDRERLLLPYGGSILSAAIADAAKAAQLNYERNLAFELLKNAQRVQEEMQLSVNRALLTAAKEAEAQRLIDRFIKPLGQTAWTSAVERLRRDEEAFHQGLRRAMAPWESVFGAFALNRMAASISDEPASATTVEATVTEIVTKAIAADRQRTDWKFVVQLIIAILMHLAQTLPLDTVDAVDEEHFASIASTLLEHKLTLEALASRPILRRTQLRARPTRHGAVLRTLPAGATVVVLERRSKWTRVRIIALDDEDERQAGSGWVLNKYLGRGP